MPACSTLAEREQPHSGVVIVIYESLHDAEKRRSHEEREGVRRGWLLSSSRRGRTVRSVTCRLPGADRSLDHVLLDQGGFLTTQPARMRECMLSPVPQQR